jgi:hypothetical protein
MIAPGMIIDASNQVECSSSAGNTSDFVYGGFGFLDTGELCLDSDAPSGSDYVGGFRVNSTGCIFHTTSTDPTDVWISGLRVSAQGQLITEAAAGASFVNGNPLTAAGVFATTV